MKKTHVAAFRVGSGWMASEEQYGRVFVLGVTTENNLDPLLFCCHSDSAMSMDITFLTRYRYVLTIITCMTEGWLIGKDNTFVCNDTKKMGLLTL